MWLSFKLKIYELRNRIVPKTTVTGKPSWNKKGRIPVGKPLQEAIRQKHARHRRWMSAKKKTNDQTARLEYTKARNKVKRMMRQAKKSYEKEICLKSKSLLVTCSTKAKNQIWCWASTGEQQRHYLDQI